MTALAWPEPVCDPLTRATPSTLNTLDTCAMRLAYQMSAATRPLVARSTRTSLGIVAHALTEEATRGSAPPPGQRRPWLEGRWDQLVAQELALLKQAWPGRVVPEPDLWPGYVATRTRLLRRLNLAEVETSDDRGRGPRALANQGQLPRRALPSLPWVELRLDDAQSRLRGTPDRVEIREGRLRVVDFKTGVHQSSVRPAQVRQLLLYAHLVACELGELPHDVVIQNIKGQEEVIPVVAKAVEEVVLQAQKEMRRFNEMQAAGVFVANPNADNCRGCPFRVACLPYWVERTEDWPSRDVRGVVTESLDGRATLTTVNPKSASSHLRLLLTAGVEVLVGDEIVALDLERAGPGTARMKWDSRYRRPQRPS